MCKKQKTFGGRGAGKETAVKTSSTRKDHRVRDKTEGAAWPPEKRWTRGVGSIWH